VDGFTPIAVEDGGMVIPQLNDDEEIQRIRAKGRFVPQSGRVHRREAGLANLLQVPDWDLGQGRVDEPH